MEDTLRALAAFIIAIDIHIVLILVLMEDTLRDTYEVLQTIHYSCLNPCFNGRYSQSIDIHIVALFGIAS